MLYYNKTMRNDILIGIIITLLNEGKCSYSYLAEKYEVSKKTIQRYMEIIEMAGVPTISHFGRYGGTEITSAFNLENNFFSKQEMDRLLTHIKASPISRIDNLDRSIEEKIELNLKGKKEFLSQDNYIIDYTSWGETNLFSPLIKVLANKLNKEQTFVITYISPSGEKTTRTISPYKLVFKDFKWYLVAYCHTKKEVRIFKFSRIHSLVPSEDEFYPLNLTSEEILGHLNNFFKTITLTIKTDYSTLPDVEEWLKKTIITPVKNEENKIIVKGTASFSSLLIDKLLSFSDKITVLAPSDVIKKIKEKCEKIVKIYA